MTEDNRLLGDPYLQDEEVLKSVFEYLLSYEKKKMDVIEETETPCVAKVKEDYRIEYRDELLDYCVIFYSRIKQYSNYITQDASTIMLTRENDPEYSDSSYFVKIGLTNDENLSKFKDDWLKYTVTKTGIEGTSVDINTYDNLIDFLTNVILSLNEILIMHDNVITSMINRTFHDIPYYADEFKGVVCPTLSFDTIKKDENVSKQEDEIGKSTSKLGRPGMKDVTNLDRISKLLEYFTPNGKYEDLDKLGLRRAIISEILGVPLTTINSLGYREQENEDIKKLGINSKS